MKRLSKTSFEVSPEVSKPEIPNPVTVNEIPVQDFQAQEEVTKEPEFPEYLLKDPNPFGFESSENQLEIYEKALSDLISYSKSTVCNLVEQSAGRGDFYDFIRKNNAPEKPIAYLGIEESPIWTNIAMKAYGLKLENPGYLDTIPEGTIHWVINISGFIKNPMDNRNENNKYESLLDFIEQNIKRSVEGIILVLPNYGYPVNYPIINTLENVILPNYSVDLRYDRGDGYYRVIIKNEKS